MKCLYQQNPYEKKVLFESRKGECWDEILKHVDNCYYAKVNPTKEHFFVLSKDQVDIIEAILLSKCFLRQMHQK